MWFFHRRHRRQQIVAKPTFKTDWAYGPEARLREPLESQRELGWTLNDAPASSVVNYWMNAVHLRLDYFENTLNELQEQVSRHATEIATHSDRLSGLETRVGAIEAFISELAEKTPREREPLLRIPELRPGIVIPAFDPVLPVKEEEEPPNIEIDPKFGESVLDPKRININDKGKNGDNNI